MKIIVWTHKHGSDYYDASTPETLEASARAILEDLVGARYITPPEDPMKHIQYSGIDMELAQLDDDTVAALPTQSLRDEANKHKETLAGRFRRAQAEQQEWDELQKILAGEEVYAPDWVRQADSRDGKHKKGDVMPGKRITAWMMLQARHGGEYESFELEDVHVPEVSA